MRQNIRHSGWASFAAKYCRITGVCVPASIPAASFVKLSATSFAKLLSPRRNRQNIAPARATSILCCISL